MFSVQARANFKKKHKKWAIRKIRTTTMQWRETSENGKELRRGRKRGREGKERGKEKREERKRERKGKERKVKEKSKERHAGRNERTIIE